MKISVVIPTYKPKEYLWECLNSLNEQTFPKHDFEVIIVLNGCFEPWHSDITHYIATNMNKMNINFIHTEQGGVSNARNIALDQVKGEYVTFIDDDDWVSPRFLELLYEKVSPDIVSICYPYAFNDGDVSHQLGYDKTFVFDSHHTGEWSLSSKVRKFFSGPWMKLIPMTFIQDRRFDKRFKNGEDSLFMFLISDKINKCRFTSREAVYYRRFRENSAVTVKRSRGQIVANQLRMMREYLFMYLKKPFSYNCNFFITRMLAAFRSMFL